MQARVLHCDKEKHVYTLETEAVVQTYSVDDGFSNLRKLDAEIHAIRGDGTINVSVDDPDNKITQLVSMRLDDVLKVVGEIIGIDISRGSDQTVLTDYYIHEGKAEVVKHEIK